MSYKTLKIRWARKLLKALYFVVLTDTESVIALQGVDPHSSKDAEALATQQAELVMFHDRLGQLIKEHAAALAHIQGGTKGTNVKATTPANRARRPTAKPSTRKVQAKVRTNPSKKV